MGRYDAERLAYGGNINYNDSISTGRSKYATDRDFYSGNVKTYTFSNSDLYGNEDEYYKAGLDNFEIRKQPEWQRINQEKLKEQLQSEEDSKPTALKAIENLGSKMKETIFGKDAQRELQKDNDVDTSTHNKALDTATDIGGTILGYSMPMGEGGSLLNATSKVGERVVDKIGNRVTNKIAQKAIKGAAEMAPLSLYDSAAQGDDVKTAAKRFATDTALGVAGEVGSHVIGKSATALRNTLKDSNKVLDEAASVSVKGSTLEDTANKVSDITSKKVDFGDDNLNQFYKSQGFKTVDQLQSEIDNLNAVKARNQARINEIQKAIEATPSLSPGTKMQRELEIGKLNKANADIDDKLKVNLQLFGEKQQAIIPDGAKQSKFAQTVAESSNTSPELSKKITDENILYQIKPNEQTLQRAKDIINNNYDEAVRMAKDPQGTSAEHTAVSQLLMQKAQQEGRWQDALDIVEATTKRATNQGQAIQALSMWNKLTPEGMLKYAQQTIEKANKDIKNPAKKLKLSDKMAEDITNSMNDINNMVDGRGKTVKTAQLLDKIHSLVPSDVLSKISSVQTMAQLLNPKTAIRNVGGNTLFAATENLSQLVGVPIDTIVSKVTGTRSVLAPSLKTQAQGFKKGFSMGLEDALKGIDTSGLSTQFDVPSTKVFKNKFLGGLETAMNVELKASDRAFYQAAFEDSLREQMKIAKAAEPTEKMIEAAHLDGLYRTFQDKNKISTAFSGLKRLMNGGKQFGFGDFILKYPKTPANILSRGIDYSPIGISKGLFDLAKIATETGTQRKAVQELSRGIVGTGLIGAGMVLAKTGILTGKTDKDADAKDFKKEIGLGGYKLNLDALKRFVASGFNSEAAKAQDGDTIMNYDWLQPTAMALSAGVNLSDEQKTTPGDVLGAIATTVYSGMDTLAEQPVVSGVLNVFNGYDNSKKLQGAINAVASNAPASFIPTFVNQVRQMVDNTSRNTNSDSPLQKAINVVKNKIPGLSESLPANISTTGKVKENYQNGSNNLFNVFLNPAFVSKYEITPGTKLLLDLYDKTGSTEQFPRKANGTVTINGKKVTLDEEQKATLQEEIGNKAMNYIEKAANSANFNKMSDENKLKAIKKALDDAGEYGRNKIIKEIRNK